jgi:DNA-directed RNA polymerase subunit F
MENGKTDLQFLLNAAQGKQPYNDPAFMDDAYLYLVPDKGESFMIDFHPIPFDSNAKGDYSHRPGNFINQIFVGDYSDFYPFKLFRNTTVWNAKARGEAYYYENTPNVLPARGDVDDAAGQTNIDDLPAFISDGRKEALMAAVSFIISQYELLPEKRKFLVIRDESSERIELWIAAIEHAFSPRIAASVPFATRLDNFATANRYTINQLGTYQTQINLQDPNQKQRYRAMIVGVDERDKTNAAAARSSANSPFVLLDGREKHACFDADTSDRYYRLITMFDDAHIRFCREFLQMLGITEPSADIYRLLDIYELLENTTSLPNAKKAAESLSFLGKYAVYDCPRLKILYNRVKKELPRFLQENIDSSLQIIKWLKKVSLVVRDENASQQLTGIVCKAFEECLFSKSDTDSTLAFWEDIKNSEFASDVANYFVAPSTLRNYTNTYLQQAAISVRITFVRVYLECAALSGTASTQDLKKITQYGLKFCVHEGDTNSSGKILEALSQNKQIIVQDTLLSIAKEAKEEDAEFIVKLFIDDDNKLVASDASMMAFLKKLRTEGMEHLILYVLKYRIDTLSKPADIEQFVNFVRKKIQPPLNSNDLVGIFEALDRRLIITDAEKGTLDAASAIQQGKPPKAVCVNSAHLYAIGLLNDRKERSKFTNTYNGLKVQRFPSETNPDYIRNLTEKLFKAQLDRMEFEYIVRLFSPVPVYIAELVSVIFDMTKPKRNDDLNIIIDIIRNASDRVIDNAIIEKLFFEKFLSQLDMLALRRETQSYFRDIVEGAKEIIRSHES